MSFIISANYRDRRSPFKWLVREEDQKPSEAKAYKNVIAGTVTFGRSSDYEEGFGCKMVATAQTVVTSNPETKEVPIRFNGYDAFTIDGEEVSEVEQLILSEEGMRAVQ